MPLVFNQSGPYALQGQVFTAALGTAIAFSAGLALAYTGLGILNPVGSGAKVTILRASCGPTAVPTGIVPWGIAKLGPGTATLGTLSAFSGVITCAGGPGTAATGATSLSAATRGTNQGTSVCTVFGTATVLNGTAGPTAANGLNWVEVLGANGTAGIGPVQSDSLAATLYPGESAVIVCQAAVTALAGLVWLEGSL